MYAVCNGSVSECCLTELGSSYLLCEILGPSGHHLMRLSVDFCMFLNSVFTVPRTTFNPWTQLRIVSASPPPESEGTEP